MRARKHRELEQWMLRYRRSVRTRRRSSSGVNGDDSDIEVSTRRQAFDRSSHCRRQRSPRADVSGSAPGEQPPDMGLLVEAADDERSRLHLHLASNGSTSGLSRGGAHLQRRTAVAARLDVGARDSAVVPIVSISIYPRRVDAMSPHTHSSPPAVFSTVRGRPRARVLATLARWSSHLSERLRRATAGRLADPMHI